MFGIVRSELLKMRHSFSMKLIFGAPLATVLVGFLLSSHAVQYSAYNWWYTMLLPVVIALWAAGAVIREKNTGLQNIVCLPFPSAKIWIGKGLALTAVLFISNLLMWLFTTGIASFTTMNISPLDSIIGCMLLFLTCLWQLPFVMLIASKTGYLPSVLITFVANIVSSTIGAEKAWFFLNPYAIPARVVCPFFKIRPNGLPIEDGSPLLAVEHIFPALAISLALAAASFWICSKLLGSEGKSNG